MTVRLVKHGTTTAYCHDRCSCDACREAWREYMRRYRQDHESGQAMTAPADVREATITKSQAKVLRQFMRDGASNAEIATRLFLAEDTVKSHVKELLRRTGCSTRTALAIALFRGQVTVHVEER